jgi:translation machinery-associated protein 16
MAGPSRPKPSSKKEKIFHPDSRKAAQLSRTHLRKSKLAVATIKRSRKHALQGQSESSSPIDELGADAGLADVYGFFYHALPPVGVLTLEDLHVVVRDVWLARHDQELEQERAVRRKGRPKSTKEAKLEEIKLRETEEYRSGIGEFQASLSDGLRSSLISPPEVPDLTSEATVQLFRKWDQKEVAYVQLLRFIRISSSDPAVAVVSKPGKHHSLRVDHAPSQHQDQEMSVDEDDSILSEPPSRFASTIATMDGPL